MNQLFQRKPITELVIDELDPRALKRVLGASDLVMLDAGLVEPARLRELFESIESGLYRYPAITPASFRSAVDAAIKDRP